MFCSNQRNGRLVANSLTLVGEMRVSIGPAISVRLPSPTLVPSTSMMVSSGWNSREESLKGRLMGVTDTDYGLREFALVDPSGNLLRLGSRQRSTDQAPH